MKMMIVIREDGRVQVTVNEGYKSLQEAVGGFIEGVYLGEAHRGYVNEEGKILGLPMNPVATALWHEMNGPTGDVLCGPLVIVGSVNEDGDHDGDDHDFDITAILMRLTKLK